MAASKKKELPDDVYIPFVETLFRDRFTLAIGVAAQSTLITLVWTKTGNPAYLILVLSLLGVGLLRALDIRRFAKLPPLSTRAQARKRENRYIVLGAMIFSPGMIPSYLLVKELGMINTYYALIIPGLISAWNLIIVRNFFMNLPSELLDAAKVDGANDLQIFLQIVLPLSKAVLAVIALFYGVVIWNNFFNAILYLNDSSKWPIQLVLRQYVLMGSNLTSANEFRAGQAPPPAATIKMAIVVVATVPILLVYPFLQRYFTKGVLTGSIKG